MHQHEFNGRDPLGELTALHQVPICTVAVDMYMLGYIHGYIHGYYAGTTL